MPPKKRGRPSTASTAQRPKKRVRVGETSTIGAQNSSEVTESGRAKRSSAGEPNYNAKRAKAPSVKTPYDTTTAASPKTPTAGKATVSKRRKGAAKLFGKRKASITPKAEPDVAKATKRKPGRPKGVKASSSAAVEDNAAATPQRRAGRPKKAVENAQPAKVGVAKRKVSKASGHRSKAKAKEVGTLPNGTADDVDDGEETEASESGRQYWLMKAEPESRVENGVDLKFSIDDLKANGGAEAWDGVRNHAARNNMRAMRMGDHAFFYHSNCKVPGIAGIVEIVGEHAVDETAFDPQHPYYDPKSSRENPKWDVVYVQYVRKFPEIVKLADLRSFAHPGGALEKMQLLRQGRLSVSAVKPKEWAFILSLVGKETDEDGEDGEQVEDTLVENAEGGANGTKDSKDLGLEMNLVDDEAAEADDDDNEGVGEEEHTADHGDLDVEVEDKF